MKITILQGAFLPIPPKLGGAVEKMWFALSKEFVEKGHEVVYISRLFDHFPNEEWIDGVHHKRVKGFDTPASGIVLKFLDLLYSLKGVKAIPKDTDVVVTNTFWAPIIANRHLKNRCMIDVARMPKRQMVLYKSVSRLRANSSPVSKAIQNELSPKEFHKIITVPNPIPFKNSDQIDFSIKEKLVIYTGRVHPEKGLNLLIRAFKTLPPGWKLKIIGPSDIGAGGGGEDYEQTLKELAGNADIGFTGAVYDIKKLNDYYVRAAIFVYPSVAEKGETFGLAPLEAMAFGCVPVVSDLECFKDFITNEKNGLIFNHRQHDASSQLALAIMKLQQNPALRSQYATEALKVRNTHSPSYIAEEFIGHFKNMVTDLC